MHCECYVSASTDAIGIDIGNNNGSLIQILPFKPMIIYIITCRTFKFIRSAFFFLFVNWFGSIDVFVLFGVCFEFGFMEATSDMYANRPKYIFLCTWQRVMHSSEIDQMSTIQIRCENRKICRLLFILGIHTYTHSLTHTRATRWLTLPYATFWTPT